MRIAQVAPLTESVPPEGYGGTERIVSYLTEELVRLGHDVTLFATADSETSAELEPMSPRGARSDPALDPRPYETRMLAEAYRRSAEFDVIHCHTDYVGLPLAEHATTPTIVTLHGRLDLPGLRSVFGEFPDVAYVSISDSQRTAAPNLNWVATIHHGLPEPLYSFQAAFGEYLLFLGRICPEKGPESAIRIATRAGIPLRIAAKVDPTDREYFAACVQPLLDHPAVDFVGEVGGEQKLQLLAHARALLFPIDWPEPFGLVMIEALACGTPVIARRRGSVPEIVRHGETGFVCETDEELREAVSRLDRIDRRRCRSDFENRFTDTKMTQKYVALYEAIRQGVTLPMEESATCGLSERTEERRERGALEPRARSSPPQPEE
jgi:glycosyltransferase involved in cell wall biosynthesis